MCMCKNMPIHTCSRAFSPFSAHFYPTLYRRSIIAVLIALFTEHFDPNDEILASALPLTKAGWRPGNEANLMQDP